jgi:Lrp/AsnC family leucine-responsive transcriptional regulator
MPESYKAGRPISMVNRRTAGAFDLISSKFWRRVLEMPTMQTLDAFDTRILAELQADARLSLAELGRRVHLSQPAVAERVRKLEAAGVITGYRATVNLAALGYGIRALVRVGRADQTRMTRLIAQTPEIVNAWNVTGEDSWMLEIAVVDVEHLDAVVTQLCLLAETSTSIILKTLRQHQVMLPRVGNMKENTA